MRNEEVINGKLMHDGTSGDEKRAFIRDGFNEVRIEFDIDDTDRPLVRAWMNRIIKCVNACRGIKNPVVTERQNENKS